MSTPGDRTLYNDVGDALVALNELERELPVLRMHLNQSAASALAGQEASRSATVTAAAHRRITEHLRSIIARAGEIPSLPA